MALLRSGVGAGHRAWGAALLLAACLLAPWWSGPATSAEVAEERLKAGFLRNFIEFATWPGERHVLTVCLLGQRHPGAAFDALNGYRLSKSALAVWGRRLNEFEDCDVIYVPAWERGRLEEVLEHVRGKPVLVVADIEAAVQLGATLSLHYVADGRLGFDANLSAAKAAGLGLSSRLLQLARRVY